MSDHCLRAIQMQLANWQTTVFGLPIDGSKHILQLTLGAGEEIGELQHHVLKQSQGIRIDQDHEAGMKDAIGDTCVYLMQLCSAKGWDFERVVSDVANHVMKRTAKDQQVRDEPVLNPPSTYTDV